MRRCDECGALTLESKFVRTRVHDPRNNLYDTIMVKLCQSCFKHKYAKCRKCNEYHPKEYLKEALLSNGFVIIACDDCISTGFWKCDKCNRLFEDGITELVVTDDHDQREIHLCPNCTQECTFRCVRCHQPGHSIDGMTLWDRMCHRCRGEVVRQAWGGDTDSHWRIDTIGTLDINNSRFTPAPRPQPVFTIDCERYYPNVTRSIPREAVPREELSVRPDAPVYFFVTGRHLYSFDRNPLHVSSDHRLSSLMSDLNRRNVRSSDGIQEVKFRKDKETRKIMDDPDSEI